MLRIAIRRLIMAVPILIGVTVVVFLLVNVLPGDPAAAILGDNATPAARVQIAHQLGLDQPLPLRYLHWLGQILSGNLGYSPYRQRPVADLLTQAVGNTLALAASSALVGLLGGVVLGFIAGRRRGTLPDRVISMFALSGLSIPSFFLAVVMLMIFSAYLRWFPAAGTGLDVSFPAAAGTPMEWYGVGPWPWRVRALFPGPTPTATVAGPYNEQPQQFMRTLAAPSGALGVKAGARTLISWNPDPQAKQYQVDIDPYRLRGHRATLPQVVAALQNANQNVGGNILTLGSQAHNVRLLGLLGEGVDPLDPALVDQMSSIEADKLKDIQDVIITQSYVCQIHSQRIADA